MDKKPTFGIIGTGMIAGVHARALDSLPGAVLCGAADADPERAGRFADSHGIRAYGNARELLEDASVDAVCICTPSGFHADNALDALAYHKHVVLEKPIALSCADADRIIAACRENDRKLTVISQMRFADHVQYIRRLLAENAFGRVTMCSLYMKYWREPAYYADSAWRGTKRFDGGALLNQGIHGVDLLCYLMGEVHVRSGVTGTLLHPIEGEDTAAALLSYENGAMGVIEVSTCAYPGLDRRLELVGEKGHVILRETEIEKLVIDRREIPITAAPRVSVAGDPAVLDHTPHARQIQNFIDAVDGKTSLVSDAKEARRALQVIEDIYSGGRQNRTCAQNCTNR